MNNSLGELFTVTSFGESHGKCVGVIVDGCPAGLPLAVTDIQKDIDRRRPSGSPASTSRKEKDKVEVLSGLSGGYTTGAPLCLVIMNEDVDSSAYEKIRSLPRPGHADFTAREKYGGFNDWRGGGRLSGRNTATYVMAGVVARKVIDTIGIEVFAHTVEIGGISAAPTSYAEIMKKALKDPLSCADASASTKMAALIEATKKEGDSLGGIIEGIALNVPVGLGEPVFDSLDASLAKALLSIPAVKGVEFGSGFSSARKKARKTTTPLRLKVVK